MGKNVKLLVIAASVAAILAVSIVTMAAAAGPNGAVGNGICDGQGAGQGVCSDTVTKLLGLTTEEIQAQRQEGKSLVEIAATKGVSEQQLVEAIMAAKKAEVQAKVTAGTITQEQADLMLKQMEQNTVRAVNRTTVGKPEWAGAGGNGQRGQTGLGQGLCDGSAKMSRFGRAAR